MDNKINPYITDVEEIFLIKGIETDENFEMYLTEIEKIVPPLTPETEKQLLQNLDDKKTRSQLASVYLRFVIAIAVEYINNGMYLMDLISAGNLGLIHATESFDNTGSFSEYAEKLIRHKISTAIECYEKPVRIPIFTTNTIERSIDENRNITVKKLAEVLKYTEFDARQMSAIYRFCKRENIKIVRSADPYINYDVKKILSAEGIEICKDLKEYFTEIKRTVPYLTPETEKQFLQKLNDKTTRTKLSEGYLRFVVMIAKEYIDSDNSLLNLIASGNEGLRKAVESFDCTENISFALLAEWLIRQKILEEVKRDKREIPIFYKRKK
ncbi:MAG: hypothetical protein K2J40_02170 [Ruminococcus sp.]|nr:hypothetical protein [Ruminococcus sp.]